MKLPHYLEFWRENSETYEAPTDVRNGRWKTNRMLDTFFGWVWVEFMVAG